MTTNETIEIDINSDCKVTANIWELESIKNDAYFTYPSYDCYGHCDDNDVDIDREEAIKLVKALTKTYDITVDEITP